jgi:hypothetical protein
MLLWMRLIFDKHPFQEETGVPAVSPYMYEVDAVIFQNEIWSISLLGIGLVQLGPNVSTQSYPLCRNREISLQTKEMSMSKLPALSDGLPHQ